VPPTVLGVFVLNDTIFLFFVFPLLPSFVVHWSKPLSTILFPLFSPPPPLVETLRLLFY